MPTNLDHPSPPSTSPGSPITRFVRLSSGLAVRRPVVVFGALAAMFVTSCVLLWPPSYPMSDLRVYYAAARGLVDGADVYTVHQHYPGMGLGFTYPPFAAIVLAPLAIGEHFARLLMTSLSAIALLVIGWVTVGAVRPGWPRHRRTGAALGLVCTGLLIEPVWSTFGLGQVNLILMALLMVDLLGHLPQRYRGVLVGVATGIKLTPGIFIVLLLVTRRFREAALAAGTTVGTMLVGWLVMPGPALDFWTRYIFDPGRPGPAHYISNQSLRGAIARITENSGLTGPLWLLTALITAAAGLSIARRLYDHRRPLDAVVITAFTGLLVSPISWSNHWVWALPATVVVWSWALANRSRPLWIFAATWTVVFAIGLPWWVPFTRDRELDLSFLQSLAGDSYALCGVAVLAVGAASIRRRPADGA